MLVRSPPLSPIPFPAHPFAIISHCFYYPVRTCRPPLHPPAAPVLSISGGGSQPTTNAHGWDPYREGAVQLPRVRRSRRRLEQAASPRCPRDVGGGALCVLLVQLRRLLLVLGPFLPLSLLQRRRRQFLHRGTRSSLSASSSRFFSAACSSSSSCFFISGRGYFDRIPCSNRTPCFLCSSSFSGQRCR